MSRTLEKRRVILIKCCSYTEDLSEKEIHEFITSLNYVIAKDDPVNIICIIEPKGFFIIWK